MKTKEIKDLECLMESVATLQTQLARTKIGADQYVDVMQSLQHRYHEITNRYYHFVKITTVKRQ